MKKQLFLLIALLSFIHLTGQRVKTEQPSQQEENKVKNFNLIKIGASAQVDVYFFGSYDIYYDGYYYDNDYYYYADGPTGSLYLAYEHIWEFPSKIAIALEPKIGVNFREYSTHGIIGNDTKFYWSNMPHWRMGMAISTDYIFGNRETSVMLPQANGNYYQKQDMTIWYHNTSIDIAIIPFQFRIKNSPVVIESQFSLGGFSILAIRSQNYENEYGGTSRFYDATVYPYFLKGELKVGIELP